MAPKQSEGLSESSSARVNVQFAIKIIVGVATAVWCWSELTNRMAAMELQVSRVSHESTLLGDLSARMMHLEKFAEQAKADLDHLVEMQDAPITSDYQQFERLKYLEKEVDRLRFKID